jgi:hypothetical protein
MNKNEETSKETQNPKLGMSDVRCSFYEFAKQYVIIKDTEGNEQNFSDKQLNEIKEMMNKYR